MTTIQQSPYLRQQRQFPIENVKDLANQTDHAYIDIAQKVNARTIGVFSANVNQSTGESYYFTGSSQKQQSLRRVYNFTGAGNVPHGLNWASVAKISHQSFGSYTDGTSWFGAIFGTSVAVAGLVTFYVTSTNIVVVSGAGAPAISSGYIDLEWISTL